MGREDVQHLARLYLILGILYHVLEIVQSLQLI